MLTAPSMAHFFSLDEGNWNKVWHDSFGHVMLLEPGYHTDSPLTNSDSDAHSATTTLEMNDASQAH